jgi:2-C-methyl-D-erythritol 4-phosphate cytidylyltransferase/2-C-methyl-D-erythritol 2,4-cyclodiphosphate synthase
MSVVRRVAIVLGAGAGRRLGAEEPKVFLPVGRRAMLSLAAAAAAASPAVDALIVVAPEGWEQRARPLVEGLGKPVVIIGGGLTRHGSVRAATAALSDDVEAVACHDAARPFAPPDLFSAVFDALGSEVDGVIPVMPILDTVKRLHEGVVVETVAREALGLAQTPQAFHIGPFLDAHARATGAGLDFTDDAAVLEWAGYRVETIAGDPGNFKITTIGDLANAAARMTEELHG